MTLSITAYPDFPIAIKNGVAARVGQRVFAGLGSAGTQLFYLDLETLHQGWQPLPTFPASERNDAVMVATEHRIWVFSGAGLAENSLTTQVLTDGYYLEVGASVAFEESQWLRVSSDTPVGLLGANACEISPDKIAFFGGYNKPLFDDFVRRLSLIDPQEDPVKHQATLVEYMSMAPEDYQWNQDVWLFDCQTQTWQVLMKNPYPANCGASLIHDGHKVVLIEGEVKPGLRSTQVKQFTFHPRHPVVSHLLPCIQQSFPKHEGVAGAFSGLTTSGYLVAGGAYFIGSQQRAKEKQWYTHQGLTKTYCDDVWLFSARQWQRIGRLPRACAYGMSVSTDLGMLVIGGEDGKGHASTQCALLQVVM
ncbi:YjhT family mutarotase [Vibrio nomapromontoriensis]|uniref:YjhT family mutarotase n=1 Tax=Vibrio nomapromontoriensis TaxID=2910246 RepID=UPI003D0E471C